MKGTSPQPAWPLPTETQATTPTAKPEKTISRITLALLDEYSEEKGRGYDPYDTARVARAADVWRRKPKRD
jgi:hypothetical protein